MAAVDALEDEKVSVDEKEILSRGSEKDE